MLQKGEKPGKKAHTEELKYVVCFKESVLAVNKVYIGILSTRGKRLNLHYEFGVQ